MKIISLCEKIICANLKIYLSQRQTEIQKIQQKKEKWIEWWRNDKIYHQQINT